MPLHPNAHPSFTGRHGLALLGITGGISALAYLAMIGVQRETREREGNIAIHKGEEGPDYISREALEAVRPTIRPMIRDARLRGGQ